MIGAVARYKRELSVAAAYALLLAALLAFRPAFYQHQFRETWIAAAPVLVLAVGMTLVILARHIDISIGSQVAVCAVVGALASKAGLPMPVVLLVAVACGALLGAFNGWLIAFRGLPSIVVTLAVMVILAQALQLAREGEAVRDLPHNFQWFGLSQNVGQWLLIVLAMGILVAFGWGARWLAAGRAVYAVGSDPEAARLAGVRPRLVVFCVFVLMGALAGLASLLTAVQQPQVDPNSYRGLELKVIAAVVVGGTAISGGRGTLIGTLIGVALLGALRPTLAFLGLQVEWERAAQGLIILLAVASDGLFRRAS